MYSRCKATVELCDIKPYLSRVAPQVFESQLGRLGKKHVMILPKLSLVLSAARSFCRSPRLRMNRIQREIPVGEPHLAWIALKYLLYCRVGLLAERAFKVGEFHDRHRPVHRTANRRALGRHLNANNCWRLKTVNNLTLRSERFDEKRSLGG